MDKVEKLFGVIGNEFINLYSDENPILDIKDTCYFLFTNKTDYHIPMIAKGVIFDDIFSNGLHKLYKVKVTDLLETPKIVDKFIIKKSFFLIPINKENKIGNKKLIQIGINFDFNKYLFPTNSFFVRDSEIEIRKLRTEYIKIIRGNIEQQLSEINENFY